MVAVAVTVSCPAHIFSFSFLRKGIGTLILFRPSVCSAESLYFLDSHSHEWLMRCKQKTLKGGDLPKGSWLIYEEHTFTLVLLLWNTGAFMGQWREKPQAKESRAEAWEWTWVLWCPTHSWAATSMPPWCETMKPLFDLLKSVIRSLMLTAKFNFRLIFSFLLPSEADILLFLASVIRDERSTVSLIVLSSYLIILKISPWPLLLFFNASVIGFICIYLTRFLECAFCLMTHVLSNLGNISIIIS